MCVYIERERGRWRNSQEGGLVASCNEPIYTVFVSSTLTLHIHALCTFRFSIYPGFGIFHKWWYSQTPKLSIVACIGTQLRMAIAEVRWMKGRKCSTVSLQTTGGLPKPWADKVWNEQRHPEHQGTPAIPSHHIIFALQTPPLDGQSGPISCARHAACYLCRRGQRSLYKRIMGYREGIPKLEFYQKDGSTSLQKCPSEGVCWATGANLFWKRWAFLTVISKMFVHLQSTHSRRQSHKGVATPFGTFANGRLEALEGLTLSVSIMSYNVYIGIPSLDSICRGHGQKLVGDWAVCSLATNWAAKDVPRATGLKLLLTNSHPTRLTRDMAPRPPWHSSVVPVRRQLGRVAPCTPCILCERLCSCHNFLDHCIVCVACGQGARDHEVMESEEVLFNHVQKS